MLPTAAHAPLQRSAILPGAISMLSHVRTSIAVVMTLLALSSTGCVWSLKPLSDAKTSKPDLRLLGTWEFEDKEEKETHTVVVTKKKDAPNVLEASTVQDGKKETGELFCTKIGKDYFVSIGEKDDAGKIKYSIAKYDLKNDSTLSFSGFDAEFFAAAVGRKELKGTIKQEVFKDVTLDDTADNLRKFLEKHGQKCFTKETDITLKRIKKGD
jgi:hypothetical protein